MLHALNRTHFTIGLKLHSQVSAVFFFQEDREKAWEKTYVTTMTFDFIGPLSNSAWTMSHMWTHAHSLSLFFHTNAVGIRFHEGRIPRNQTLGSNGSRTVHVGCGRYTNDSQQIEEKQTEEPLFRVVYRNFTTKCPTFFYRKLYAICCRKSCRSIFHDTCKLLIFSKCVKEEDIN